jgi:hypothetical protein
MKIENEMKMKFPIDKTDVFSTEEEQKYNKKLNLKFYYDETNNMRKILFKNEKMHLNITNNELFKNFVLGGIILENNQNININHLKELVRLDKTVKEMKLKHFGKGDFLEILNSKKIESFFNWLINENINIHYISVNILYWIIVDIIDSINNKLIFQYNKELKSILYILIKSDIDGFLKLAYSFNYPNIKNDEEKYFIKGLLIFINKTKKNVQGEDIYYVNLLKKILKNNQEELIFLKGKDKEIENNLSHFYLSKIYNFPNSYHCFDDEFYIIEDLKNYNFQYKEKDWKNYEFINSKNSELIQISDIIIGIIGKFNEFSNITEDFSDLILNLNKHQIDNFKLFLKLLNRGAKKNKAFQNDIAPISTQINLLYIYHYLNRT